MDDLIFLYININAAQCIDHIGHCRKIDRNKVCDIQIQVLVQHTDRTGRTAEIIALRCLAELTVCIIQIGVTVNGHQFDIFRLIVDAGYQNRIAVCILVQASLPGINTEQCNIGITF